MTKTKVHVTLGHATVMATVTYFGHEELASQVAAFTGGGGEGGKDGEEGDQGEGKDDAAKSSVLGAAAAGAGGAGAAGSLGSTPNALGTYAPDARFDFSDVPFDWDQEYAYQDKMLGGKDGAKLGQWALLQFESPIHCPTGRYGGLICTAF